MSRTRAWRSPPGPPRGARGRRSSWKHALRRLESVAGLGAALLGALLLWPRAARAWDPYLEWHTLETPHFHVHYHGGLHEVAQRVGTLAEDAHRRLAPELGWAPDGVVHIALTDTSEFANGSATPLPYNTIRLFATAPGDMSVLGDYDDWLDLLVTHEHTHILHLDNVRGFAAVVNGIFGKTLTPNTAQPRWITEGLAVVKESAHSTGGRMRSTQFDMFLRADVLEGRVAGLDQMSHDALRWPSANLWYLYGSRFLGWVFDVYGSDVAAAIADDYAHRVIPYGINRSVRRATGRTYDELYDAWKLHLREHYAAQLAPVLARGLREGRRLTFTGRNTLRPRVAPRCYSDTPSLLYFQDDGQLTPGIYQLPLTADGQRASAPPRMVSRAHGNTLSFDRDCAVLFDAVGISRRRYRLFDLFRQLRGTTSVRGFSADRERLTTGARAREPDVSPDGGSVVYVTHHAGTSTLRLAALDAHSRPVRSRRLVPSARYEQAYTPRFSPDGKHVAYSVWTRGGYRDIRIVDVATGAVEQVTHDRALDQQPTFSPDGRFLFFTSDRTGIANIYALVRATGELYQVTNVRTGAYTPELSADGRLLYYTGYTADGFDLFVLELDESRWLPAPPPPDDRPPAAQHDDARRWPVRPYTPLETLGPRSYSAELATGTFGTTLALRTSGADVAGFHAFAADGSIDFSRGIPQGGIGYRYARLPFVLRMNAYHRVVPRAVEVNEQLLPSVERITGASSGLSYEAPGNFDTHVLSLSYAAQNFSHDVPFRLPDPYARLPVRPHQGLLGVAHLGYSYGNAETTLYGVGPEKGFTLGLGADYASSATASEHTLYSLLLRSTAYVLLPWARHHVLALGLSAGTSGGTYPRRGMFFTGGFTEESVFDTFLSNTLQSAFVLRGYEPRQFRGRQFALLNAEYRLPLWYADRGVSTLPVYLRNVSGAVFADYGGAFDRFEPGAASDLLHLGVGAELWFQLSLGYFARTTFRLGWARGVSPWAPPPQTYFVAASAF